MKKKVLADWLNAEAPASGLSYRQLAKALGTSPTTMSALRNEGRDALQPEVLQAIALRRRESVEATAKWLDVEPPGNDMSSQIRGLSDRLDAIERKVEFAYQMAKEQTDPSLSLASYLAEKGVNVRSVIVQKKTQAIAAKVAKQSSAYERFLLIVLGVIPALPKDLKPVSDILHELTGEPWTPEEVSRVLKEGQRR